ncbi:MAG TPA: nickel insertion protein, partial [Longimicrobiales bacterium]|nr:nickel insertion protein [Longimicrobiales bacterium]
MRGLIFDPFAGISGDMVLGALVDVGLPVEWLEGFVASLGLEAVGVAVERVNRRGISCARVRFELPHEHAHRHLRHVLEIVDATAAPAAVRALAAEAFRRLAAAEAEVHGTSIEKVHFHEVGALDAIVDVAGACLALELLGVDRVECSPLPL